MLNEIEAFRAPSARSAPGYLPGLMKLTAFKRYIDFTEADAVALCALWPDVELHQEAITAEFYERAMAHASTRAVLSDSEQVGRLMRTLKIWLRELLNGPWDDSYAERRRQIGLVHVKVGLRHDAMFTAMSVVQNHLIRIALDTVESPARVISAITKVCHLDLALMTSTYHDQMSQDAVRGVQHLLVAHMPAIVMLVDRAGTIIAATPSAVSRFGGEAIEGRDVREAVPEALAESISLPERLERVFDTGRGVTLPHIDWQDEHGNVLHFAVTLIPLQQNDALALLYIDDHTMSVRNETLLRKQESLAQLGALSATIAHELRNPLAGISGALQVIAQSLSKDDRYASIIGKVLDQIRSLNRLVSDLLAFARPTEADLKPDVQLAPIARSVAELIEPDFEDVQVRVVGDTVVNADPHLVRQIFVNLLINAAQAMDGHGVILIRCGTESIEVEDSGPGIPDKLRTQLFEPFVTSKLKGTGLGLAISRQLAGCMDGALELIEPRELGGACFRLSFESADADAAE